MAALNRIITRLAGRLFGTGLRVNEVGRRAAVMSEGSTVLPGDILRPDAIKPPDIVEAVVAFCDCRDEVTGKVAVIST